jgi:tetratricopeptide (TPR) repeat protein
MPNSNFKFFGALATGLLLLWALPSMAQKAKKKKEAIVSRGANTNSKKDAKSFYDEGDFHSALDAYLNIYKTTPKSTEVNLRIGICYLSTNFDKSKAIPFLEYTAKQKDAPGETNYCLARAYQYTNRFDDAMKYYQLAQKDKYDTKIGIEPERQIAMCKAGIRLMKTPVNVKFENMGKEINSPYSEYNPFITADESMLIYSSRRKGNVGGVVEDDPVITADVYSSTNKDGKWQKAKSIGIAINTEWDEESVGLSPDGQRLFLYEDNLDSYGDLYSATLKGKTWSTPELLGENVNSKNLEMSATISPDGNTLYFSSDRKEGSFGGFDIYKSLKLPTGEWGLPINLGPNINSKYDEDMPYIFADGKTLYFSSNNLESMGGYDIFSATYDELTKSWTKATNIGYPLNTTDDNMSISFNATGQYAYLACLRPEGLGDLDIYKVTFNDVKSNNLTVIKGQVVTGDTINPITAQISLFEKNGSDAIGLYTPNTATGGFIIIAPSGAYDIEINENGFAPYKEQFIIPENKQPQFLKKKFVLTKPKK